MECFFAPLQILDVGTSSKPPQDASRAIGQGHSFCEKPAVVAIAAPQAGFEPVGITNRSRMVPDVQRGLLAVEVEGGVPAISITLLQS